MAQTTNIGLYKLGAQSKLKDFPNLFNDDLDIIDSSLGYGFGKSSNPTVKAMIDSVRDTFDTVEYTAASTHTYNNESVRFLKSGKVVCVICDGLRDLSANANTTICDIPSACAPTNSFTYDFLRLLPNGQFIKHRVTFSSGTMRIYSYGTPVDDTNWYLTFTYNM